MSRERTTHLALKPPVCGASSTPQLARNGGVSPLDRTALVARAIALSAQ